MRPSHPFGHTDLRWRIDGGKVLLDTHLTVNLKFFAGVSANLVSAKPDDSTAEGDN